MQRPVCRCAGCARRHAAPGSRARLAGCCSGSVPRVIEEVMKAPLVLCRVTRVQRGAGGQAAACCGGGGHRAEHPHQVLQQVLQLHSRAHTRSRRPARPRSPRRAAPPTAYTPLKPNQCVAGDAPLTARWPKRPATLGSGRAVVLVLARPRLHASLSLSDRKSSSCAILQPAASGAKPGSQAGCADARMLLERASTRPTPHACAGAPHCICSCAHRLR